MIFVGEKLGTFERKVRRRGNSRAPVGLRDIDERAAGRLRCSRCAGRVGIRTKNTGMPALRTARRSAAATARGTSRTTGWVWRRVSTCVAIAARWSSSGPADSRSSVARSRPEARRATRRADARRADRRRGRARACAMAADRAGGLRRTPVRRRAAPRRARRGRCRARRVRADLRTSPQASEGRSAASGRRRNEGPSDGRRRRGCRSRSRRRRYVSTAMTTARKRPALRIDRAHEERPAARRRAGNAAVKKAKVSAPARRGARIEAGVDARVAQHEHVAVAARRKARNCAIAASKLPVLDAGSSRLRYRAVRNATASTRAKIAKAAATRRAAVFFPGVGRGAAPQRPLCEDGLEASRNVTRLGCNAVRHHKARRSR